MTRPRLSVRRALASRGPSLRARRLRRVAGRAALLLLAATAASGLGSLATEPRAPAEPRPLRFADAAPLTVTYAMTGTCTRAPCPAVLVARRSRFAMSDGSDWTRIVFTLDDAMWTEWRDGRGRVVGGADIPPRPPHVVFE